MSDNRSVRVILKELLLIELVFVADEQILTVIGEHEKDDSDEQHPHGLLLFLLSQLRHIFSEQGGWYVLLCDIAS